MDGNVTVSDGAAVTEVQRGQRGLTGKYMRRRLMLGAASGAGAAAALVTAHTPRSRCEESPFSLGRSIVRRDNRSQHDWHARHMAAPSLAEAVELTSHTDFTSEHS